MFFKKNIPRKDVFWMSFECVLEHIYCKFTVCILFDIFFQKDSDIVSDIFKKEICHFPFTKHKPTISHFSRCGLPGVVPPKDGMTRSGETTNARARVVVEPVAVQPWRSHMSMASTNRGHNGGVTTSGRIGARLFFAIKALIRQGEFQPVVFLLSF